MPLGHSERSEGIPGWAVPSLGLFLVVRLCGIVILSTVKKDLPDFGLRTFGLSDFDLRTSQLPPTKNLQG